MMMAVVATSSVAMAQTEGFTKGSLFLSGSVGFSSEKEPFGEEEMKVSSFNFSPRIGYFVSSNIAVGINASIGSSKETNSFDDEEEKFTEMAIGAFGRYYFTPANKFSMFLHLNADYVSQKNTFDDGVDETEFKVSGFQAGLAPGLHYFISNRLALETSVGLLGFRSMKPDVDDADATTNFDFNLGLNNLTIGLVFKIK